MHWTYHKWCFKCFAYNICFIHTNSYHWTTDIANSQSKSLPNSMETIHNYIAKKKIEVKRMKHKLCLWRVSSCNRPIYLSLCLCLSVCLSFSLSFFLRFIVLCKVREGIHVRAHSIRLWSLYLGYLALCSKEENI